ncbi:hypothetical protein N0V87_001501 [Didymella glomerata]|uniref:Uncharacterized protein n=1 Tax=Didymella glomerata TaxID=749621 RepID=A0A9W8X5S5_9PLEO|nr:hypothetical protein N0V87_001501 [Didymella glomerata]
MSALNDALEDLAKLRLRSDLTHPKVSLTIEPEEARQCIEAFIEMMNTLVVPDIFAIALDVELLRSLPNIISSPYINVDAGAAYLKALEHVPAWLDTPTETDMDGYTAAMAAWVAINNLDYQLSWKFHCKACHWVKSRGVDKMDVSPAMTVEEEQRRESIRYLYYHILSTDCLFRLFYNKPTILRWDPHKVKPPSVMTARNLHPSPTQVMISCVWTSYTARSVEAVNYMDSADRKDSEVASKVEDCRKKMEALVSDWRMEAILADTTIRLPLRCLVADHVMNIYAVIVGLKRLANRVCNVTTVDEMTVRAARKVVDTLLDFDQEGGPTDRSKPDPVDYFCHFILFYPFCAVFTLYEYIIACTNPDECEEDVRQLEHIAEAMEHTSQTIRPDLKPFAKTIKALNKVSRTIQESRRKRPLIAEGQPGNTSNSQLQPYNLNIMAITDLDPSAFDTFPDFPMTMDGDPDPLGFVRAMENDFIGRNWHENWWDMGGGLDNGMNYMAPNT